MDTVLKNGTVVGNYRIDGNLGRGGMGVVYEATQLSLNRTVALKVLAAHLSDDPGFRDRFRREGQIQAALDHPHIVTVFEAGESPHGLFLAMALVRGPNLKDLILSRELDPSRGLRILRPVADALDAAHEAGLIHRDIKPHNILVGRRDTPYLADFGLTKGEGQASLTQTGHFVGTLDYISPEQIKGKPASTLSDVYALAAVLYECLTGVVPFPKESEAAVLYAHLSDPPPQVTTQRPDLSPSLDRFFEKAMAKDPADRPSTATELLAQAELALGEAAISPPPPLKVPQETGIRPSEADVPTSEAASVSDEGPAPAVPAEPERTHGAGVTDTEIGAGTGPASETVAAEPSAAEDRGANETVVDAGQVTASAGETEVDGGPVAPIVGDVTPGGSVRPGSTATARSPWLGKRMLFAAGLVVVAVGAAVTVVIVGGPAERGRGAVTETIQVGVGVDEVAVGKGSAWALNSQANELSEIEPGTDTPRGPPISVDEGAQQLAASDEGVWLLDPDEATVSKVDPATRQVTDADISVPPGVEDIAAGDGSLWLLSPASATVTRVEPKSGETEGEPVQLPSRPERLAYGEGKVWIQFEDGTLGRLDPGAEEIDADRNDIGQDADALAVGHENLWLASTTDDTVSRAEIGSGRRIGDPIPVGSDPVGIATDDELVWVANTGDGTVTQIAP